MTNFEDPWLEEVFKHLVENSFDLERRSAAEQFDKIAFQEKIREAIVEFDKLMKIRKPTDISMSLVDDVARQVGLECVSSQGKKLTKRKVDDTQRLAFEATLIMLFTRKITEAFYTSSEDFLAAYPEFSDRDPVEQRKLFSYRNVLVTALKLLKSGSGHKNHLLDLCTRISENYATKYITGTGEKQGTKDRISIFRKESQVEPVKKKPRNRDVNEEEERERGSETNADDEERGISPSVADFYFRDLSIDASNLHGFGLSEVFPADSIPSHTFTGPAAVAFDEELDIACTDDPDDEAGVRTGGVGEVLLDDEFAHADSQLQIRATSESYFRSLSQISQSSESFQTMFPFFSTSAVKEELKLLGEGRTQSM